MAIFESGLKVGKHAAWYLGKDVTDHIQAAVDDAHEAHRKVAIIAFAPYSIPANCTFADDIKIANYNGDVAFLAKTTEALRGLSDHAIVVNGLAVFEQVALAEVLKDGENPGFTEFYATVLKVGDALRTWLSIGQGLYVTADVIDKIDKNTKQKVTGVNVMPSLQNHLRTLLPQKLYYSYRHSTVAGKPQSVVTIQRDPAKAMNFVTAQESENA